jgi:uncharacterized protein (DUF488 family)
MHDRAPSPPLSVWTIGHSNQSLEAFFGLLDQQRIEVVVDVRSSPYSGYTTQFNREPLQAALQNRGTKYLYLGDVLGGRPEGAEFYDDQQHVQYDLLARSPAFQQGIQRLVGGLVAYRVALLCGEEDPTECHRRLLLGRVLTDRGVRVLHIRGDGRTQSEEELAAEERFRETKGQLSLFEVEEHRAWLWCGALHGGSWNRRKCS